MRKLKLMAVCALMFIGVGAVSAQDFGVVNLQDIYDTYPAFQTANSQLEALSQRHRTEIQKKQEAMQAIEQDVQTKTADKSQAELQAMIPELEAQEKDYMAKQQDLMNYQQAASKEIQEKQDQLMDPIDNTIKASIDKVASSKGLKYVMEKSLLLYSNGLDITAEVKKDLGIN